MSIEAPDPYRWTMLVVAWLAAFTSAACINCYSPLLNEMMSFLSMSYSEAALLMSLAVLTTLSFQVVGGVLTSRIGTKKTIVLGSTIIALSQLTMALAPTFTYEAVFRFLMGLGSGLTLLCAVEIMALWFPPRELGRAMGIQASGWAAGNVLGILTPIPFELAFRTDWRGPFLMLGAFAVVVTLVLLALTKEKSRIRAAGTEGPSWAELVKVKELWLVTIGNFGAISSSFMITTWLPMILMESGWPPTVAAIVSAMFPLMGIPGNIVGGIFSDRLGRKKPILLISGVLGALFFGLFIFVVQTPLVWIVTVAAGWFMFFFIGPLLSTLPGIPEIGPGRSGAAWGVVMIVSSVGAFISPIVMGQIRMVTGSYSLGFVLAAAFGAMLIVPGVFGRETGWKHKA
jgi:MFS family permease